MNWFEKNILTILNIVLTVGIGVYIAYLHREPEYKKTSHTEKLKLLGEILIKAQNNWKEILSFLTLREQKRGEISSKLIYEQFIEKKKIYYIKDQDTKILIATKKTENKIKNLLLKDKDYKEKIDEISYALKNIFRSIRENSVSLKYILPSDAKKKLENIKSKNIAKYTLSILKLEEDDILQASKIFYEYIRIIEISYYSGLKPNIVISTDDLDLSQIYHVGNK